MGKPMTKEFLENAKQSHANVTQSNKVMFESALLHFKEAVRSGDDERAARLHEALQQSYDFAAEGQHDLFCRSLDEDYAKENAGKICKCTPSQGRFMHDCPIHGEKGARCGESRG